VVVALGIDPTTGLFFYGTVSGGLGVLILMSVAAVAVIRFFHRHPHGENRWRRTVAPVLSATFLLSVLLLTLAFFGELLGTTNPIKIWTAPTAYALIAVAGLAWAYRLKAARPETWAVIGHGDRAHTGRPVIPTQRGAAVVNQHAHR
jgi:hypothetical protein